MLGGDNWHLEETFGALGAARRLIAEVLDEKIAAGYFSRATAERLARRILHDNAADFFHLP
jgi:20S proteasome alpha/beta subunit